jgi:hypothetical protein
MPAKSAKQKRFMQAVANNPKFANKVDVPQSVGAEYTKENKMKKKMNMGGPVADAAGARAMDPRMAMAMEAQRRQAAAGGMKKGGGVKKMKMGGSLNDKMGRALARTGGSSAPMNAKGAAMKKGGSVKNELEELGRVDAEKAYTNKGKSNLKSEKKRVVNEIKKKGYKKGGMVSSASKRADGIAQRGRTRGQMR